MKNTTPILVGAIILFIAIASAGIYAYSSGRSTVGTNPEIDPGLNAPGGVLPASIKVFGLEGRNFVVKGDNLSRVEIWTVKGASQSLVGTAQLKGATAGPTGDTWSLAVPSGLRGAQIYAKGYDRSGNPAARMDLSPTDAAKL